MAKIVGLAKIELDETAKILQAVQSQLQAEENQLDSLKGYQSEYLTKLRSNETTTLQHLNRVQAFLEKLNQAVGHQEGQIQQLEASLDHAKLTWTEKRVRVQALEKVHAKLAKNHLATLEKQEQKMLDDLASQSFLRQSNS